MHGSTGAREQGWRQTNERAGKELAATCTSNSVLWRKEGGPSRGVQLAARPTLSMLVVIMGCDGDKRKVGHKCTLRVISVAGEVQRWILDVWEKGILFPGSAQSPDGWIALTFSLPRPVHLALAALLMSHVGLEHTESRNIKTTAR